jgi:hypothetical protein
MFALIAAALLLLAAFGVDLGRVDIFLLGLAFWALHFGVAIAVPSWRRG